MFNTKQLLFSCICLTLVSRAIASEVTFTVTAITTQVEVEPATRTLVALAPEGATTIVSTGFGTQTKVVTQIRLETLNKGSIAPIVTSSSSFASTDSPTSTPGTSTSSSPSTNSVPATPSNSNEPAINAARSKSNAGLIAGIVISALCGLIGIFIAVVSLHKRRRALRQINQMNRSWPAPFFSNTRTGQDIENPVQPPTARITEKSGNRGFVEEPNVDPINAEDNSAVPPNTAVMIQEMVARALRRELAGIGESREDVSSRPPTYYNGSVWTG